MPSDVFWCNMAHLYMSYAGRIPRDLYMILTNLITPNLGNFYDKEENK